MKRLALISPYFGALPEYFELWCRCAAKNKNIDFLIYTDCDVISSYENIKITKITFEELKRKIQALFDFEIRLSKPYKFCDYKPATGLIFADDLADYRYWGYIDLDTIPGNLEKFLTNEDYDKIYRLGHLCIYRNTPENNRRFMLPAGMDYKEVFTTDNILIFDENEGIQKKYELLGIKTYTPRCYADITRQRYNFTLSSMFAPQNGYINNYKRQVFFYENSAVYRAYKYNGEIKTEEFNYIHFSSRKMPVHFEKADNFFITPSGFYEKNGNITEGDFEKYNGTTKRKDRQALFKYKVWLFKRKVKKIITSMREKARSHSAEKEPVTN